MERLRQLKLSNARECLGRGDVSGAEKWLQHPETPEEQKLAAECRELRVIQRFFARDYDGALRLVGQPPLPMEREFASRSNYELMKETSLEADWSKVREFGNAALALKPASKSLRHLISERLRLLQKAPISAKDAPHQSFAPGVAVVDGFDPIPVLGHHGSWGISAELNRLVQLLKMGRDELGPYEEENRPLLISLIGMMLYGALEQAGIASKIDLIIPIPQEASRYASRGFSQQQLIAEAISAHSRIPQDAKQLVKIRETQSLRGMVASQRASELRGSMSVFPDGIDLVKDNVVLLVDDVVTWGTHFREARKVLVEAGAREVLACALATGRDNLRPFRG